MSVTGSLRLGPCVSATCSAVSRTRRVHLSHLTRIQVHEVDTIQVEQAVLSGCSALARHLDI